MTSLGRLWVVAPQNMAQRLVLASVYNSTLVTPENYNASALWKLALHWCTQDREKWQTSAIMEESDRMAEPTPCPINGDLRYSPTEYFFTRAEAQATFQAKGQKQKADADRCFNIWSQE